MLIFHLKNSATFRSTVRPSPVLFELEYVSSFCMLDTTIAVLFTCNYNSTRIRSGHWTCMLSNDHGQSTRRTVYKPPRCFALCRLGAVMPMCTNRSIVFAIGGANVRTPHIQYIVSSFLSRRHLSSAVFPPVCPIRTHRPRNVRLV